MVASLTSGNSEVSKSNPSDLSDPYFHPMHPAWHLELKEEQLYPDVHSEQRHPLVEHLSASCGGCPHGAAAYYMSPPLWSLVFGRYGSCEDFVAPSFPPALPCSGGFMLMYGPYCLRPPRFQYYQALSFLLWRALADGPFV
ncbi:hypothetical protein Nepgr_030538 [Nepenthes gracilis]|uniref:Uncharacterized protein n=1 Tax=Nepenthes gracilis TaxID=150966 RepID=A0AAD3Y5U4_NEPGR|nr:hypothetical protein Nepgr_030538 [Nepenthes gracilis]